MESILTHITGALLRAEHEENSLKDENEYLLKQIEMLKAWITDALNGEIDMNKTTLSNANIEIHKVDGKYQLKKIKLPF